MKSDLDFEIGVDKSSGQEVVHVTRGPLSGYYLWLSPEYEYKKIGQGYRLSYQFDILGLDPHSIHYDDSDFKKHLTELYKCVIMRASINE
jgi:hypothetical protein